MRCTAHGYYSTAASHSVALKQFSPSSCIQEERDLFINKNICNTKHIYTTLMLHTERRGLKYIYTNGKFLHDMLVNWLYGGIRILLFS